MIFYFLMIRGHERYLFFVYLGLVAGHLHEIVKEAVGHYKLIVLLVLDLVLERCACSCLSVVSESRHVVQRCIDRPLFHIGQR